MRNLTANDFRLDDAGQTQTVTLLGEPGKTPIELALLLDVSGSVYERFPFQQQVAARFLKEVITPKDAVSVFAIGRVPRLVQGRTLSGETASMGIMGMEPTRGPTAFFDSIVEAARYLGKTAAPGTRRVEVALSDGEDNHSQRSKLPDALRELQRADCIYYSINPSGPSIRLNKISLKGQENMETLAAQTGGTAFLPDKLEDLEIVFRRITVELQAQYLLGFYPASTRREAGFRRITVRVPNRPDLRIRARQGYYVSATS